MSQGFLIIIKHASKLGWMLCLGIGREYHIIWYGNVCACVCVGSCVCVCLLRVGMVPMA